MRRLVGFPLLCVCAYQHVTIFSCCCAAPPSKEHLRHLASSLQSVHRTGKTVLFVKVDVKEVNKVFHTVLIKLQKTLSVTAVSIKLDFKKQVFGGLGLGNKTWWLGKGHR